MFRIAFDPERPVVATSTFPDGTCQAGEVFDWRAKGLQPIDALAMFRSGLLTHVSPPPSQAAPVTSPTVEPSPEAAAVSLGAVIAPGGEKRTFVIDGKPTEFVAGPTINVATPEQQRARRGRGR